MNKSNYVKLYEDGVWAIPNPVDAKDGDECHKTSGWGTCFKYYGGICYGNEHRRPMPKDFPGEGYEVVGMDEEFAEVDYTVDCINWIPLKLIDPPKRTVRFWLSYHPTIICIRRRKVSAPVEQDEWKYCKTPRGTALFRYSDKNPIGQKMGVYGWENDSGETCEYMIKEHGWHSITRDEAMRRSGVNAKQPEVTKGPQFSTPQPIPVSERLPEAGQPFWYWNGLDWKRNTGIANPPSPVNFFKHSANITHWLPCVAPYAIPPTPPASEDEEFEEWIIVEADSNGG